MYRIDRLQLTVDSVSEGRVRQPLLAAQQRPSPRTSRKEVTRYKAYGHTAQA
jgi:hypothetical protein